MELRRNARISIEQAPLQRRREELIDRKGERKKKDYSSDSGRSHDQSKDDFDQPSLHQESITSVQMYYMFET